MRCWGTRRSLITWPSGSLLICLGLYSFLHPRRWQLKRAFLRSIIHDHLPPKLGNLKGEAADLGTRSTYPLHTSERECLHCPQCPSLPFFSLELLISIHSVPLDSGSRARLSGRLRAGPLTVRHGCYTGSVAQLGHGLQRGQV